MKAAFDGIFKGKKVLLTGDSGFKGSWLAIWLKELGAEVFGQHGMGTTSQPLAAVTILLILARTALMFRENRMLLEQSRLWTS